MVFESKIHWYMYRYLEIKGMQIHIYLLLLTLTVPLEIGKCTPGREGVHVSQVGNLCFKRKFFYFCIHSFLLCEMPALDTRTK